MALALPAEIDLSQYQCEKCGKQGVSEEGLDVFVAQLCDECFWKLWREYLEATSGSLGPDGPRPEGEWTDAEARAYYYAGSC